MGEALPSQIRLTIWLQLEEPLDNNHHDYGCGKIFLHYMGEEVPNSQPLDSRCLLEE